MVILPGIASELMALPEGSTELRNAHVNLRNICAALVAVGDLSRDPFIGMTMRFLRLSIWSIMSASLELLGSAGTVATAEL